MADNGTIQATDDNTIIKGVGSNLGKEIASAGSSSGTKLFRFPENLGNSKKDNLGNIIKFSIFTYKGGGYNRLSGDGTQDLVSTPNQQRIADIALSIPTKQQVSYESTWSLTDSSNNALSAVSTGIDFAKDIWNGELNLEKTGKQVLGSAFIAAAKNIDSRLSGAGSIQAGLQSIPYVEAVFQGVSFRKFNFNFRLIPRNAKELQSIVDIVQIFKWASRPGFSGLITDQDGKLQSMGAKLFTYPSVFQIKYITSSPEKTEGQSDNPWLHKFQPSVCTSVGVDYNADSSFNFISYHNPSAEDDFRKANRNSINTTGAPIFYTIDLKFTELSYVTKESINRGY